MIERDLQTLMPSVIQNTSIHKFEENISEASEHWCNASIFNDTAITSGSEINRDLQDHHSKQSTKVTQNSSIDSIKSHTPLPNIMMDSFDDVKLDDLCLEFDNDDLNLTKLEERVEAKDRHQARVAETSDEKTGSAFHDLPHKIKSLIFRVKKINALYDWQDECLRLKSVINRRNLIYALPTSGGKTLVAEILMLREITCKKRNAIFILPFVAIVQEKIQSLAPFAVELDFLIEEYAGSKGGYPPVKRRRKNSLYVCTIEKSMGVINSLIETKRLKEVGMIVVDELHLLGEDGGRGATLEGLLAKLMYMNADIHIVGMSATIGNLDEVARFLKADVYTRNFRPVELKEYIKCEDRIWLINTKEEDIFTDERKINYRVSSQFIDETTLEPKSKKSKQSIILTRKSRLELSTLGKAAMKGSIDLQTAYYLHEDLKSAQRHLILTNDLHVLFLVTPYDVANQIKPVGSVFYEVIMSSPSSVMDVSRVLGFTETVIIKLREGIMPKNISSRVFHRFYVTLMLHELQKGASIYHVAEKYHVTRGITQNLLSSTAAFASSVVRFCQEIPEFWAFIDFLKSFSKKITAGPVEELEILMELPAVKIGRARQLYDAGFKNLQAIASTSPTILQKHLKYASRKTVDHIIAAANLLLMEKIENLKDEYAEMMECLQASQFQ
ncbi:helicase POLQ-like [Fopius arisanus]|uniref:Helicase POLQ-like n=1 Tax=Fopius arisanus TaxID=64838 RepID=A0A9R1TJ62_9HYME|nr:PREDICTED: helicase POLQ-like [Fopius arisanus]